MMHILCLTSIGGIPIFSRKRGDCDSLSFATIGSLNGIHMFCKSQGMTLQKTEFEDDGLILWKDYDDCVTFIGATRGVTAKVLEDLLDISYGAMIGCVSLNEIKHIKNIEHLKRELKLNCFPVIDKLMDCAENELLRFTDCILVDDSQQILAKLIEFSEMVGSPFCCISIKHKIIAGTEGWWDLNEIDRKLLTLLLETTNESRPDIPVFLPRKSPNIAYRLVSVLIRSNIQICVLCGAEPSYGTIETIAQQIWKNELATLDIAEQCYIRNLPIKLQLDQGILGFVLINRTYSKYVVSRNLQPQTMGKRSSATASSAHRLDILRTFFHQSVNVVDEFLYNKSLQETNSKKSLKILESYWCLDYHKCHALNEDDNLILILYMATIPTHTMRLLTQKTLKLILSEKDRSW